MQRLQAAKRRMSEHVETGNCSIAGTDLVMGGLTKNRGRDVTVDVASNKSSVSTAAAVSARRQLVPASCVSRWLAAASDVPADSDGMNCAEKGRTFRATFCLGLGVPSESLLIADMQMYIGNRLAPAVLGQWSTALHLRRW
jgi:hypothetical protein